MSSNKSKLFESALKEKVRGEVLFDPINRCIYSVDASIFEVAPLGIVKPIDDEDIHSILLLANEFEVPVIARGAATGITGGCLGRGLIIDLSAHRNAIREINYTEQYAVVEPGVIQDQLNAALSNQGYRLGPDTSTGNRATIGGMMANNAAGAHSLKYGSMLEHTIECDLFLMNGEVIHTQPTCQETWKKKCLQANSEGVIYATIEAIRRDHEKLIRHSFPLHRRRVSGYNLNTLIDPFPLNLTKLLVGAEGSLGIASSIKVAISPKLEQTGLCLLLFDSILGAVNDIPSILSTQPVAVELIDSIILEAGRKAAYMQGKLRWLPQNASVLLAVEFESKTAHELIDRLHSFADFCQRHSIGNAHIIMKDPIEIQSLWELRKSGLGLLLSKRAYSRAIAFIEDISVPPEALAPFMRKFIAYLDSQGKKAGIYGHAGSGCMHIRPYIDLRSKDEVQLMQKIMLDVADLLLEHHGVFSGEHGDGFIRTWLNQKMFGNELYDLFYRIKEAFDPSFLMNPGKVIGKQFPIDDLRLTPKKKILSIPTFLNFESQGGFSLAIDLCNGNGQCRKKEGVMCPSFQATGNEIDTTRARAQSLRGIIHGDLPLSTIHSDDLYQVMDLCIECKGCQKECPSQVDMAKMKAEFLYQYQQKHGISLRNRLFANVGKMNSWMTHCSGLFNGFIESFPGKKLREWVGISTDVPLPKLATERFSRRAAQFSTERGTSQKTRPSVILFNDTFTEFNHPEIGWATLHLLDSLGYDVIVTKWQCCGRPLFTKGLLHHARKAIYAHINALAPFAQRKQPILFLEPSCYSLFKTDALTLIDPEQKEQVAILAEIAANCYTLEEFLLKHLHEDKKLCLQIPKQRVWVHGHCHQKALTGMDPTIDLFRALPGIELHVIDAGCCGMAGAFGYEAEHVTISGAIGELKLFPTVRKIPAQEILVANGMSCRSHVCHHTGKRALHLAEFLGRCCINHH